MNDENKSFSKNWQLNERHYGALTGLNKIETVKKLVKKVHEFRRSWDIRPDPLEKESPYHPNNIDTYKDLPKEIIPNTESLKDTYERVTKFYENILKDDLKDKNILISAHGNSIRALCKFLFKLNNEQISKLEIPTGNPLVLEIDNQYNIQNCKYLDQERAKDLVVF